MKVEREIDIEASPQRVYEVVMDPRRLEQWVTIHAGLKQAPDGELRAGSELTQCLKLAGQRVNVHWTVAEDRCPERVVWEGHGPLHSEARVVYELAARDSGTRFRYVNEYHMPGGPLAKLGERALARRANREADRSLERLKALLESP